MKILVVDGGGRGAAIVRKLHQDGERDVICAPGNAGIAMYARCVDVQVDDIPGLLSLAKAERVDFTIFGTEVPLVLGAVDEFAKEGRLAVGPPMGAAQVEGSKGFCKELLWERGIPTAEGGVFSDRGKAEDYIRSRGAPIVIKPDGLTGGKGVVLAQTVDAALAAVGRTMATEAGRRVVVEDCLEGEECSFFVLTDGSYVLPWVSARDRKYVYHEGRWVMTGGMFCQSPAPGFTEEVEMQIMDTIMKPVLRALAEKGHPYRGVLYGGLMLTEDGPKVLEFNCRLGDPEAQVLLPRLKSELLPMLMATADGTLDEIAESEWSDQAAACVVLASQGYPEAPMTGFEITGILKAEALGAIVYHAGTMREDGRYFTNGGRVLNVVGLGDSLLEAEDIAYAGADAVDFLGKWYYRK